MVRPQLPNYLFCRHVRQAEVEATAADCNGAGELAGVHQSDAIDIRRREAEGRTTQGTQGRISAPSNSIIPRTLISRSRVYMYRPEARSLCVPDIYKQSLVSINAVR